MAIASGSYPEGHWFESNRRHHMWTLSSAGRASALQAEGHRFEPYSVHHFYGRVVQLVRMPACHAGGRGFEPLPHRQFHKYSRVDVNSIFLFVFILNPHSHFTHSKTQTPPTKANCANRAAQFAYDAKKVLPRTQRRF